MISRATLRALLVLGLVLFSADDSRAQEHLVSANTVTTCGSVNVPVNEPHSVYMAATGKLCVDGTFTTNPAAGSQELDQSDTRTLNAATSGAQQTYNLNGQATFSFNFTGLTASGATVSFFQSNDWNGTTGTFTPVSEVNTGTGLPSVTRNVDGQSAIGVEGGRAVRVQVTTTGTGTITIGSNISTRSRYAGIRGPIPGIRAVSSDIGPAPSVVRAATSLVAKNVASNLYGYHATFASGGGGYLATLDATTAPASGAVITPVECTPIAALSSYRTRQDIPDRYVNGVVLLATQSCTTYTPVATAPAVMAASVY